MTKTLARFTIAWLLAYCAGAAMAQGLNSDVPTIDIKNGTATATPIAVVPFGLESGAPPPQTDVHASLTSASGPPYLIT